ncbi:MAG: glycosyltransferase family 4 protein [Bacteroidales bacterium]|nr:glycosyltransferase family 4 protein [Bacteroidales bacterium]
MKTRVLLIAENAPAPVGGIERHCHNILDLFRSDEAVEINSISRENIRYKHWKIFNKIIFNFRDLENAIKESRCDVVHVHGFASIAAAQAIRAAKKLKLKIIYTAHYHPFNKLENPLKGTIFFYLFLKPLLKSIHQIITINKEDSEFFRKYHSGVTMIPNWIRYSFQKQQGVRKTNMILFVGRADANKGIDHLLALPADTYEIHCVTGAGPVRDDFVVHSGIDENSLRELYRMASVVVVPSRYEAFSYVTLEALAHGTPVVISDQVRIRDYLDGISGVTLFRYGNKPTFIRAVAETIGKEVDTDAVAKIFEPGRIREELRKIYQDG